MTARSAGTPRLLAATAAALVLSCGRTPAPELVDLAGDVTRLRAAFAADPDAVRVVALLSPT